MKQLLLIFALFAAPSFAGDDPPDVEAGQANQDHIELVAEAQRIQQLIQEAEKSSWKIARQCDVKILLLLSGKVAGREPNMDCVNRSCCTECCCPESCADWGCWHRGLDGKQVNRLKTYVAGLAAHAGRENANSGTIRSSASSFVGEYAWESEACPCDASTDQFWKTTWLETLSAKAFWNSAHKPFADFKKGCSDTSGGAGNSYCERVVKYSAGVTYGCMEFCDMLVAGAECLTCGQTTKCGDVCCANDRSNEAESIRGCNKNAESCMPGVWMVESVPIAAGELVGNAIGYLGGRVFGTATVPFAMCAGSGKGHVHRATARGIDIGGAVGRYGIALPLAAVKFGAKGVGWLARGAATTTSAVIGGVLGGAGATLQQLAIGGHALVSKISKTCADNVCL